MVASDREGIFAFDETASRPLNGANLLEVIVQHTLLLAVALQTFVLRVPARYKKRDLRKRGARLFSRQRLNLSATHFTVNLPLENSLRSWKPSHSRCKNDCRWFESRTERTSISLTGKRILRVRFASGRITLSWMQGTRSRCGVAVELPFQFAGSAQKRLSSFDHLLTLASGLQLLNFASICKIYFIFLERKKEKKECALS